MRNRLPELIKRYQDEHGSMTLQEWSKALGWSINTFKAWRDQEVERYDIHKVDEVVRFFGLKRPDDLFYFEEASK